MVKLKSILKEILQTKFQIIIFILCLILSIGTFISVDSLKYSVENYVERDSKILNGGDLIIDSNREYGEYLKNGIKYIEENYPNVKIVNSYSFTSIAYSLDTNSSILSQIRIVSNEYPLYGNAILESNNEIKETLTDGNVIVEKNLLTRLNTQVGSKLKIGDKIFTIKDVITYEPDRPLDLFNLGPRILIPEINLEEMNLVGNKSRVFYETFLKTTSESESIEIKEYIDLKTFDGEDINYYYEENNSLKRFSDNFLFFVKLIAFFIIIITGIGMTSIIFSYLEEKKLSIGIRKSLGEKNKNVMKYYTTTFLLILAFSLIFAILFSYILLIQFPNIFSELFPQDIEITLNLLSILKGIIISIIITILFSLYPLLSLKKILPIQIFRHEESKEIQKDNKLMYIVNSIIVAFFVIIITIEVGDIFLSITLVFGSLGLYLILILLTTISLNFIQKLIPKIKSLELKQAVKSLFRIGNKTILVISSIGMSLTILYTMSFVELNIQNQFIEAFPEDAPNFFAIDIPKNNLTDIEEIIGENLTFFPSIRGRILTINNQDVKEIESKNRGGDSLVRTFTLTYGDLLESEKIKETIFDNTILSNTWDKNIAQVSILDEVAEMGNIKIGDRIKFLIQGVEIEAEVVSIRERVQEGITAFFYFTFEPSVLENAPQTVFTIAKVETEKIPIYQNEIVKKFPQVTVINAQSTAKTIGDIISKLSTVISFFTIFSLIAGVLILLSSIISTNAQKTKESIFYKLVGANKKFLRKIFLYEYLILALLSSLIALLLSSVATYIITVYLLNINYIFIYEKAILYTVLTIIIICLIGLLSSTNLIRKKPIEYIRDNKVE